jgi:hypothetical protein
MNFISELKPHNVIRMDGLYSSAFVGAPSGATDLAKFIGSKACPDENRGPSYGNFNEIFK